MKVPTLTSRIVLSTTLVALLSACGSTGVSGVPAATNSQNDNVNSPVVIIPPNGAGYAAYPFSFTTYGSAPTAVTSELHTNTKAIVKIKAEASGVISIPGGQYSNFSAEYHCAQYKVELQMKTNGAWVTFGSQNTGNLNVAGTEGCTGGQPSEIIDFSAYMTPGHGEFKIVVTSIKTDFYCILFHRCFKDAQTFYSYACYFARQPNAEQYACPTKTIYANHNVNGSLEVQVNTTTFVNP